MIDFRYHLVSIVSIFLALAVGIVLGAGPLKEDIGNTLTSEVTRLREDRTELRARLDEAEKAAQARDAFTEAGNKTLLRDRLQDATLTVVVLPGADANLVKSTTSTLARAGAKIGSTVTVLDAWVDPEKAPSARRSASSSPRRCRCLSTRTASSSTRFWHARCSPRPAAAAPVPVPRSRGCAPVS